MKVRVTHAARFDLEEIWRYSAEQWGVAVADNYIDRLSLRMAWLVGQPGLWRARPELGDRVHSFTETRHVIYFCPEADGIAVLRVLHGRMDPDGKVAMIS